MNGIKNSIKKLLSKDKVGTTVILVIIFILSVFFISKAIGKGTMALAESYNAAYASEKEKTYSELYEKYYNRAEAEYHVSNRVSISVEDLKETAALEVLKVSDIEYVIEDGADNKDNITTWLEVPGEGVFVVDLQKAEFIVDDERQFVRVRAPYPEITNITIDYKNVQNLIFKNDIFNDSDRVGEDLAREMLKEAYELFEDEFTSNQYFYGTAENIAKISVECLVRQFNPDVPNLTVEVEFY